MRNDDWLQVLSEGAPSRSGTQVERALNRWQRERQTAGRAWLVLAPLGVCGLAMGWMLPKGSPSGAPLPIAAPVLPIAAPPPPLSLPRAPKPPVRPIREAKQTPPTRPLGIVRQDDLSELNTDPLQTLLYWTGKEALVPDDPGRDTFIEVSAPLVASESTGAAALALEQAKAEAQVVDSRLQKRVTLAGKALAFGDLCRLLSEKTGITLEASRGVTDDKITVFCTERSLRDVMRQVSALFGFVWERSGGEGAYRYRLTQPLRARLAEEELRNKDAHDALVALDEELHRLKQLEDETPEQLLERAAKAPDDEKKRQLQNLAMRGSGPMRLYNQLSPEDMKALQAGQMLEFSSNPRKPGQQALPGEIGKSILAAFADRGRVVVGADGQVNVSVNDDMETRGPRVGNGQSPATLPETEALSWLQLKRDELGQVSLYGGSGFGYGEGDKANFMLCNGPVAEGRSPSHKPENTKENATLLSDPMLTKKPGSLPKRDRELTTGELLETFHRLSGLDVMGDSYTGLYPAEVLTKAPRTTLHALLSSACDQLYLRWRYEKQSGSDPRPLLRFRTTDFFNRRPQEIPNRAIARWEQARKDEGALGTEALCEMAQLTDEQLDSRANARYLSERSQLLEWRWVSGLKNHWRLLATLSRGQREQALGGGIALSSLGFGLQEQFMHNVFARSTSSSQEWPALEWQREAQFAVKYTPLKPTEEAPKLTFIYRGLRRSASGPSLVYTEDERFNSYGPRPEK